MRYRVELSFSQTVAVVVDAADATTAKADAIDAAWADELIPDATAVVVNDCRPVAGDADLKDAYVYLYLGDGQRADEPPADAAKA
jgi:hypothetical protein